MTFSAFGIRFKISYFFTVAVTLFIATDRTGNILSFLVATFIHEFGHLLCMLLFKVKVSEIILTPGTIRIVNDSITTNNENLLILLSGPVANLITFIIFINFDFSKLFSMVNLVLFLFNLLPIDGLDGGSILKIALRIKYSERYADRVLLVITLIFAVVLVFTFFFLFANGVVNYSLPILFLYLILPYAVKKIS